MTAATSTDLCLPWKVITEPGTFNTMIVDTSGAAVVLFRNPTPHQKAVLVHIVKCVNAEAKK
jgi:hypothetical protein